LWVIKDHKSSLDAVSRTFAGRMLARALVASSAGVAVDAAWSRAVRE
jgi:hypothetical protein